MGDHEGRARLQAAPDCRGDATPFGDIDEVQGQQAGGAVERSFRRIVDVALMKTRAGRARSEGFPGEPQHCRGWVHAIEAPALMGFCKRLQLQAAARAEDEHVRILGRTLGQEDRGHGQHGIVAGNEAGRAFGVFRHGLRIGEHGLNVGHDVALLKAASHA